MITIVNGYVCMSCCEAAKARKGEDPHKSTDQAQKDLEKHIEKPAAAKFGPAVTFGGLLRPSADANATQTGSAAPQISAGDGAPAAASSVDVLA